MSRPSYKKDYKLEEGMVVYETKHIKKVVRADGTRAIGVKSNEGFNKLHRMYLDPYYANWDCYRLPCGAIYLMEER